MSMIRVVSYAKGVATIEIRHRSFEFAALCWRAVVSEMRAIGVLTSPRAWLMCVTTYVKILAS